LAQELTAKVCEIDMDTAPISCVGSP